MRDEERERKMINIKKTFVLKGVHINGICLEH